MMTMMRNVYTQCFACADPVVGGTLDPEAEPGLHPGDLHFHLCDPCAEALVGLPSPSGSALPSDALPSQPHLILV